MVNTLPSSEERTRLAERTGMTPRAVQIWVSRATSRLNGANEARSEGRRRETRSSGAKREYISGQSETPSYERKTASPLARRDD